MRSNNTTNFHLDAVNRRSRCKSGHPCQYGNRVGGPCADWASFLSPSLDTISSQILAANSVATALHLCGHKVWSFGPDYLLMTDQSEHFWLYGDQRMARAWPSFGPLWPGMTISNSS